jgi:hypothetical protein
MCFGDDWPGVFIRGDNAYGYITCLKGFLELHPPAEGESILEYNCRNEIEQLIGLLHSSNVSPRDPSLPRLKLPIQRMRDFVDAKLPKVVRTEEPKVPPRPEVVHRLTFEALLDGYAKIERRNKKVTDIWMYEEHYLDIKGVGVGHLTDEDEGQEVRCKLWGATIHVSWKIPMNNFVIIGEGDEGLVDGVMTRNNQLTPF